MTDTRSGRRDTGPVVDAATTPISLEDYKDAQELYDKLFRGTDVEWSEFWRNWVRA